jgi:hypothetical protein
MRSRFCLLGGEVVRNHHAEGMVSRLVAGRLVAVVALQAFARDVREFAFELDDDAMGAEADRQVCAASGDPTGFDGDRSP